MSIQAGVAFSVAIIITTASAHAQTDEKFVGFYDVDFDGQNSAADIQLVVNDAIGLGPTGFPTDLNFDFFVDVNDIFLIYNDRLGFFVCPGFKKSPFWFREEKQSPLYTIFGTDETLGPGDNAYFFRLGVNTAVPGPRMSTLTFSVLYDSNVLTPNINIFNPPALVVLTGTNMGFFYGKDFTASQCFPGRIECVVGGFNAFSITSCDDQIFDFGHNPNNCENPLALGAVEFFANGPPGSVSAIAITDITGADSFGNLLPDTAFDTVVTTVTVQGEFQNTFNTVVSGFVRDANTNAPVPGAVVEFSSTTQDLVGNAETDLGGFYFFDAVPAGTYNIRITSVDYGETTHGQITVGGGSSTRDFSIAKSTEPIDVSGQVVDADFGFPLVRVFVEAIINNNTVATTYTSSNGEFEFRGLPIVTTTTVTLRFTLDGYNPLQVQVVLEPDTPSAAAPQLKIGGAAPATLSGFVFAKQGNNNVPLSSAQVALRGGVQASTTTDTKGAFAFSAVPEGNYVIHVSKAGYAAQTISRNVTTSEVEFQNFSMEVSQGGGGGGSTDVNNDGQVNASDIQLVINTVLSIVSANADVNGDGSINSLDVQSIINAVLGLK